MIFDGIEREFAFVKIIYFGSCLDMAYVLLDIPGKQSNPINNEIHKQFFVLLYDLFAAMSARRFVFRDMQEIIDYEKQIPSTYQLIIPNEDFNRGLDLLIVSCEQIDVKVRQYYLKVVELLFAHVEHCQLAMEYAFSLEFFTRHNRLNAHKLADYYEDFYSNVDLMLDWISHDDFDEYLDVIVRRLGFYIIIHPLDVIREIVKKSIIHFDEAMQMQRLLKICDNLPAIFQLRIPVPHREDSDRREAAFISVLRRFVYLERKMINLNDPQDRRRLGLAMMAFVRSQFHPISDVRVTGGRTELVKPAFYDATDFVRTFVFDYLVQGHQLDFFLCLLEEVLFVEYDSDNADEEAWRNFSDEDKPYRICVLDLSVCADDKPESLDVFVFLRMLIALYAKQPTRFKQQITNIFLLLAERIKRDYGNTFFEDACPHKCQWIEHSLSLTDESLISYVQKWYSGLFRQCMRSRSEEEHSLATSGVS